MPYSARSWARKDDSFLKLISSVTKMISLVSKESDKKTKEDWMLALAVRAQEFGSDYTAHAGLVAKYLRDPINFAGNNDEWLALGRIVLGGKPFSCAIIITEEEPTLDNMKEFLSSNNQEKQNNAAYVEYRESIFYLNKDTNTCEKIVEKISDELASNLLTQFPMQSRKKIKTSLNWTLEDSALKNLEKTISVNVDEYKQKITSDSKQSIKSTFDGLNKTNDRDFTKISTVKSVHEAFIRQKVMGDKRELNSPESILETRINPAGNKYHESTNHLVDSMIKIIALQSTSHEDLLADDARAKVEHSKEKASIAYDGMEQQIRTAKNAMDAASKTLYQAKKILTHDLIESYREVALAAQEFLVSSDFAEVESKHVKELAKLNSDRNVALDALTRVSTVQDLKLTEYMIKARSSNDGNSSIADIKKLTAIMNAVKTITDTLNGSNKWHNTSGTTKTDAIQEAMYKLDINDRLALADSVASIGTDSKTFIDALQTQRGLFENLRIGKKEATSFTLFKNQMSALNEAEKKEAGTSDTNQNDGVKKQS